MSYCSPLGSLNVPVDTPATERRTARSNSTVGTPSRLAFCGSTTSCRFVRATFSGFWTSRVPGSPSSSFSTCAGQLLDHVEVAADHAHGDRRADRRAVHELLHVDARGGVTIELRAARRARAACSRVVFLQLHEDLAVARRVLAHDVVVVDLRVAVADVGEPALHLRHLRELFFDEADGGVGLREARAVRRLDADEELRRIGLREQAAADDGHERGGEQDRAANRHSDRAPSGARGSNAAPGGSSDGLRPSPAAAACCRADPRSP